MWLTPASSSAARARVGLFLARAPERGGAEEEARAPVAGPSEGEGGDHRGAPPAAGAGGAAPR